MEKIIPKKWWPLLGASSVLALAFLLLFFRLGIQPLRNWDEGIYAHVAQQILSTHDWLTMHSQNINWYHKPPLQMWLTAFSFSIFGMHEWVARLISALAGVGTVFLTYLLGRRLGGYLVGFLSAFILLTSFQFLANSREGMLDSLLTFGILLSLVAAIKAQKLPKFWLLSGVGVAIALMTKGAAGLVAPLAIFVILFLTTRVKQTVSERYFWYGVGLALLLALPWHIAMYVVHGHDFFYAYIVYHVVERTTESIEGHGGSAYDYYRTIVDQFAPWSLVLLVALAQVLTRYSAKKDQVISLLLSLVIVVFGLYGFVVSSKLSQYILPLYPALALAVGWLLAEVITQPSQITSWFVVLAAGVYLMQSPPTAVLFWFLAAVITVTLLLFQHFRKVLTGVGMCVSLSVAILVSGALRMVHPLYTAGGDIPGQDFHQLQIVRQVALHPSSNPLVVFSDIQWLPAAYFYSDNRPMSAVSTFKEVEERSKEGPIDILAPLSVLDELKVGHILTLYGSTEGVGYATLE
jgi:4-amino-4-deoxy-L-arabinose transferase-like glycosyltransferase